MSEGRRPAEAEAARRLRVAEADARSAVTTDAASRKAPALLYLATTCYHLLLSHHDSLSLSNLNGSLLQPTATLLPPTATYYNLLPLTTPARRSRRRSRCSALVLRWRAGGS